MTDVSNTKSKGVREVSKPQSGVIKDFLFWIACVSLMFPHHVGRALAFVRIRCLLNVLGT
jgi:hypothetical protein